MIKTAKILILTYASLVLFTACGNQLTATGTENSSASGSSQNTPPPQKDPQAEPPLNISYSGGINDQTGMFGSKEVVRFNNETRSLEVLLPFPFAVALPEFSGNLRRAPHVKIGLSREDQAVVLSIPIEHYVELTENPTTLPTGRTLPGVNGGEPPSFGFSLPLLGNKSYAYAAIDSFSIFTEVDVRLPLAFEWPFPIKGKNGEHLGTFYWLGAKNGAKSGVFLSLTLPRDLSALIAKHM